MVRCYGYASASNGQKGRENLLKVNALSRPPNRNTQPQQLEKHTEANIKREKEILIPNGFIHFSCIRIRTDNLQSREKKWNQENNPKLFHCFNFGFNRHKGTQKKRGFIRVSVANGTEERQKTTTISRSSEWAYAEALFSSKIVVLALQYFSKYAKRIKVLFLLRIRKVRYQIHVTKITKKKPAARDKDWR